MGFLKQIKDMKDTVNAAPGMVDQAMQMKAQAEQMAVAQQAAAQQAAAQAAAAAVPPAGGCRPRDRRLRADRRRVDRALRRDLQGPRAPYDYDQSKAVEIASSKGISPSDWQTAMDGWNARMHNGAVAQRFNAVYTGTGGLSMGFLQLDERAQEAGQGDRQGLPSRADDGRRAGAHEGGPGDDGRPDARGQCVDIGRRRERPRWWRSARASTMINFQPMVEIDLTVLVAGRARRIR